MNKQKRVMVGMSGGVDSSVAALLLLQQGYEVVGVTFRLWTPELECGQEESGCCSVDDVNDAKFVCHSLGIPHYTLNYKDKFRQQVVDYFAAEYARGATPNPCIACNRHIKFSAGLEQARSMGFDYIATGHYATVVYDSTMNRYRLRKGKFAPKDQSYVLYCMNQDQLQHTLMPIGDYEKAQVRALAEEHHLVVSRKPESQDICFVPDGDYASFLERYTGKFPPPGNFIDENGNVLGTHRGIWHYTIGQRKGLGVSFGKPVFVSAIDPAANTVTLSDHEALMSREVIAEDLCWIDLDRLEQPVSVTAKIRYAATPSPAEVFPLEDGRVRITFQEPQRAATRGQAIVFYDGEFVVGGGTICS